MHTPRLSHPAHGTAKKPSTGDRKQKFDSNCNFCFHDGRIATTGTRPCEKRVKSPSKGKRASPKKQEGETHEPTRLTGQTLRKRRVLATAAGQNPRNSHESQRGQEGLRKNHTTPPQQRWRGKSHEGGLQNKGGVRKTKKGGGCNADMRRKKKVRRGFGGPFQERIRYASERSHSTMQLFKNGLESGASALTIRNLASPSAVFQTSVRKRTPGRTGEVKRHLKRVIASG